MQPLHHKTLNFKLMITAINQNTKEEYHFDTVPEVTDFCKISVDSVFKSVRLQKEIKSRATGIKWLIQKDSPMVGSPLSNYTMNKSRCGAESFEKIFEEIEESLKLPEQPKVFKQRNSKLSKCIISNKKARLLPDKLQYGDEVWQRILNEEYKYEIYHITNEKIKQNEYIAFIFKSANNKQYRPYPPQEDTDWFVVDKDLNNVVDWLINEGF